MLCAKSYFRNCKCYILRFLILRKMTSKLKRHHKLVKVGRSGALYGAKGRLIQLILNSIRLNQALV